MKRVKLIYNPMSGDKSFRYYLDQFIEKFQRAGYEVSIFRSAQPGDLALGLEDVTDKMYDAIVVAGGDGSINEIVNEMMKQELKVPLGVIPAGTANDFATHLNMPSDFETCFDAILNGQITEVDVGQVNDRYFINICAGGLLANVSYDIDVKFKNTLGKMAYYLKGIEQLPKFKSMPLRIETSEEVIEEDVYLFLVLNGRSAGGFDQLAKYASINDGNFDLVAVKAKPLSKLAVLFMKMLQGEHLNDENIIYLKDDYFKIEVLDETYQDYVADIDGEKGPSFPLEISLFSKSLNVLING
ncbi:YegS/Rv2252/BmrU family lipid kinase [Halanaerocella petrolearia]